MLTNLATTPMPMSMSISMSMSMAMATSLSPLFPAAISCRATNSNSPAGSSSSASNPFPTRWLKATSTDSHQLLSETTKRTDDSSSEKRRSFEKIRDDGAHVSVTSPFSDEDPESRRGVKDYLEQTKDLVRSVDGGPPRWFSPLDCAGSSRVNDSPVLLFLPGIDGVGLGLIMHHKKLAGMFEVWCLHIPIEDRTPFSELVKLVERTVRSEHYRSPNRPIYLVGETIGACLALSVAALNPDIDLVLILANPGTSFRESQLQRLMPLLEVMPDSLQHSLPYMLSLLSGDSLRLVKANLQKGLPLQTTVGELSSDLIAKSFYLPVLADILPTKTLIWKLQMLKSASAFTNSRLHAVKAETLIISSGRDMLLPSKKEASRLHQILPNCATRFFEDNGHFIFLEDDVDLVTIIKCASFYRRSKNPDYVFDYIPPTPSEFEKIHESNQWIYMATSPVMLSTLDDGKIVRGLAGIPSEGPVLFVGYHMLLGFELAPLVCQFLIERNILVRGIAHPMMFMNLQKGRLREFSYDTYRIMGAVPVSGKNFYKLFSSKSHVLLYPGGMREALHRKGEEYKLFWPEQSEFVRMAAKFGAKIVPFGVVGEDDICEVIFDYEDQMKIPSLRDQIEELTNQVAKLRNDANGEVANQPVHLPGILPKFPGRFYYYFGKPIETEGMKQKLRDREKSHELYLQVKSEVERCITYLKEKREGDPYRNILARLVYQAANGFTAEVPTFEI